MSTPTSPRVPADPTREQLDDLDELLQRMLALPVNKLDETAAPPEPVEQRVEPAPEKPQPERKPRPPAPNPARTSPRPASRPAPRVPPPHSDDPGPPPEGWLAPLAWLDAAFDTVAGWFGSPGRWLRGSTGKSLLGWVGLLLLAAALTLLALEWLGW